MLNLCKFSIPQQHQYLFELRKRNSVENFLIYEIFSLITISKIKFYLYYEINLFPKTT
jgi:hypothetical protein